MMEALDQQTLQHTDGGFLIPVLIYLGYRAYQRQQQEPEASCDWGGGTSGGGGAGTNW